MHQKPPTSIISSVPWEVYTMHFKNCSISMYRCHVPIFYILVPSCSGRALTQFKPSERDVRHLYGNGKTENGKETQLKAVWSVLLLCCFIFLKVGVNFYGYTNLIKTLAINWFETLSQCFTSRHTSAKIITFIVIIYFHFYYIM